MEQRHKKLISTQNNHDDGMLRTVTDSLAKWQKISKQIQRRNVKWFCEWLEKTEEQIVKDFYHIAYNEPSIILEKWQKDYGDYVFSWYEKLLKTYTHNSARKMAFDVALWLRTTCKEVRFQKKIPKATESTKIEHEFTIEQLKEMYVVGDNEERAILQLGVNIGFRVEDFCNLEREPFERAVTQVKDGAKTPYQLKQLTKKEKVMAYCQLTKNTIDTLATYLKTKKTTDFLFSKNGKNQPKTERQLNYLLKDLWRRAFPDAQQEAKNIFWHLLRKYLITMMLNAKMDMISIKLVIGKAVKVDVKTYLQKVNLPSQFVSVLPFVELGNYIAIQPRTLEEQRARELLLIEAVKQLLDKVEKLSGTRPQISIPLKQEIPSPKELEDLFNGNNNNSKASKEA